MFVGLRGLWVGCGPREVTIILGRLWSWRSCYPLEVVVLSSLCSVTETGLTEVETARGCGSEEIGAFGEL